MTFIEHPARWIVTWTSSETGAEYLVGRFVHVTDARLYMRAERELSGSTIQHMYFDHPERGAIRTLDDTHSLAALKEDCKAQGFDPHAIV